MPSMAQCHAGELVRLQRRVDILRPALTAAIIFAEGVDASYRPMKLVRRARPRRGGHRRRPDRVPPEAGVDFVLATDHDRVTGRRDPPEIRPRGHLRLFHERGEMRESDWRTRMARLAAVDHGADWVINADADEFWMPRRGTLKEALAAAPQLRGVVWALTRHFVPRPDDGGSFAERMTVRLPRRSAERSDEPVSTTREGGTRADPESSCCSVPTTSGPSSSASGVASGRSSTSISQSLEQYERKSVRRAHGDKPLGQYVKAFEARETGRLEDAYGSLVVDDSTLEREARSDSLVVDTRLRDALRDHKGGS